MICSDEDLCPQDGLTIMDSDDCSATATTDNNGDDLQNDFDDFEDDFEDDDFENVTNDGYSCLSKTCGFSS